MLAFSSATYVIPGGFTIYAVCSLHFAAVNRSNVQDVVPVHRGLWAIYDVELHRGLIVINYIISPVFDC